jgi:hypothetical protein
LSPSLRKASATARLPANSISASTHQEISLRIFEKLGISTRVELVLYAVNNGDPRQAEWLVGASPILPQAGKCKKSGGHLTSPFFFWASLVPARIRLRPIFETVRSALYKLGRNSLSDATSNSAPAPKPRRSTIFAAGFLLLALALVVIYTGRNAFLSPLALVVVAAIGLAALLLQLRLRQDIGAPVRAPLGLNLLGLIFAVAAIFADVLRLSAGLLQVAALGAVVCFAISGIVVLHALRKPRG